MLSNKEIEKIKKEIEEFFKKTTFEVEVEALPSTDETAAFNIKSENPQVLIGEKGQTLNDIQHLLKTILRKKTITENPFYLDLDINGYKKKKYNYLRELAQSTADEVALIKQEKELDPMPAEERRIIHLELAKRKDVFSESIGQEPERRVVIKPLK